jgi:hypothetical protein
MADEQSPEAASRMMRNEDGSVENGDCRMKHETGDRRNGEMEKRRNGEGRRRNEDGEI